MAKINDGGPAFPRPASDNGNKMIQSQDGMTLRDYFAAKALHAILSSGIDMLSALGESAKQQGRPAEILIAQQAFLYADVMITVRTRTPIYKPWLEAETQQQE